MKVYTQDYLKQIDRIPIFESFIKADGVLKTHERIVCSISGGSDSDIVLDLLHKLGDENVVYVWFNTGLEYDATKEHLTELETKYGIKIRRLNAVKPIPSCVREYGVPFISKYASEQMMRLQAHGFKWRTSRWRF